MAFNPKFSAARRTAVQTWTSGRKLAGSTYKSSMATAKAGLTAGTLTRQQYTAQQRAASKARNTAVKTGRATIRAARLTDLKSS